MKTKNSNRTVILSSWIDSWKSNTSLSFIMKSNQVSFPLDLVYWYHNTCILPLIGTNGFGITFWKGAACFKSHISSCVLIKIQEIIIWKPDKCGDFDSYRVAVYNPLVHVNFIQIVTNDCSISKVNSMALPISRKLWKTSVRRSGYWTMSLNISL